MQKIGLLSEDRTPIKPLDGLHNVYSLSIGSLLKLSTLENITKW
jgi:hypothetical protein